MNTLIFILCCCLATAVVFLSLRKAVNENSSKKYKFIPLILSLFIVVISLLNYSGIIKNNHYQNVFSFLSLVSCSVCLVSNIDFGNYKREQKFIIKAIAVAALLEISLFNLPSYRNITGEYPVKEIDYRSIELVDGIYNTEKGVRILSGNGAVGKISGVDIPVSTVKFIIEYTDPRLQTLDVELDVKDETYSQEYRNNIVNTKIITYHPDTLYSQCDLSGKVSDMRFHIHLNTGAEVYLTGIVFNSDIPFNIQYIRFFAIVILSCFIFSTSAGGFMSVKYKDDRRIVNIACFVITVILMFSAFEIVDYKMTDKTWSECFRQESGNQISEELVEAFKKGHVYLDRETEDFLYEIDNPYDDNQRNENGGSFAWDHVLYGDHYYSYYGIAPVILLFLPYNLITGYYCPNELAILIFAFAVFCGISFLYTSFIKRWFSDISSGIHIICFVILQLSSGIWYCIGRAEFYEISLSAGAAFITWGIYFLIESGVLDRERISCKKTFLASLFFSLAVLSRPTLAVYCVCAAVFMLAAVPSFSVLSSGSPGKIRALFNRSSVRYAVCAFLPMISLGLVQMIYNYIRFESPFDFGIQYSLTINDFTKSQFHLKFCAVAVYNYLFNPPVFIAEYPFVKTQFQSMHSSGFFYSDVRNTLNSSGLFMLVPLTWFYLAARRAVRSCGSRREKTILCLKIAFPCLIAPLIIIMSVWESGYAVRYMGDFSIEIILGALVFMFLIIKTCKNQTILRLITYFACFSLVWVLYAEGIQLINQAFRYQEGVYDFPEAAHALERIISFWR